MSEPTVSSTAALSRKIARERMSLRAATSFAVVFGYLGVFLIYAPIVWLGVMSVSERPRTGSAGPFTLKWYYMLFQEPKWLDPLGTSVGIATIVAVLCMILATAVGRVLPQLGRRHGWLLPIFLVSLFVPGVVLGVEFVMYYHLFLGLKTGLWSITLGHFVWAFPFALLSVLVVSTRFDYRLLEVASDLGANPWERFWHIEYPLLLPGILTAGFFGFLLSFNELPRSIFLRGGETTLPIFTWAETAAHTTLVPLIYALSTIITVVSILLVVLALYVLISNEAKMRA
ncbi:MAG: ABC transporter permease subunit [Arenicellales bacterium]